MRRVNVGLLNLDFNLIFYVKYIIYMFNMYI